MIDQKLPHQLSIEQLLAALNSDKDSINTTYDFDSPVLSFIQEFNIQHGEELVSDIVLYELFTQWYRQGAWNKRNFNFLLGKYIPSITKNRRYYQVNKATLELAQKVNTIVRSKKIDKRKSITWQKHFQKFIDETELEKGNKVWVEADILYYVYNRWLDKQAKPKGTIYKGFLDIMELHFDVQKRISKIQLYWFYISRNITKLITKEEIERWREGRRNKNGKTNEKYKKHSKKIQPKYKGKTLYPSKKEKSKIGRPPKLIKKGIHTKKSSRPD